MPLLVVHRCGHRVELWEPILPVRREREDRSAAFNAIETQVIEVVLE